MPKTPQKKKKWSADVTAKSDALDLEPNVFEVTDGKTFELALELQRNEVPFVFVSGSRSDILPADLRSAPFIPKPFDRHQIERLLRQQSD